MSRYILYSDGASRGNPGPAGAGCVIQDGNGKTIATISEYLNTLTNNQAEYRALLLGLERVLAIASQDMEPPEIQCKLDSELIVEQMNDRYRVKNRDIKVLYTAVQDIMTKLGGTVTFTHIPRTQNKKADQLANDGIDNAW